MISDLKLKKLLVLVESSTKAKTVYSLLKKEGYSDVSVISSNGHIIKIADSDGVFNSGIFPEQNFKMNIAVLEDKKKIVDNIITASKNVDRIFIMTDDDREGELLAWSLLKFCNLPQNKCFRAVLNEITSSAVINAINNDKPFDINLAYAGLARLIIDKLIGYSLSPIVKKYLGVKSIGRYQALGLKLVSDREKEIDSFIPEINYKLYLSFKKNNFDLKANYIGYKDEHIDTFKKFADVDAIITDCKNTSYFIEHIEITEQTESPLAPFCAATLQQVAAQELGISTKEVMKYAQRLFEGIDIAGEQKGLITSVKTDSTLISKSFINVLENFIIDTFGKQSFHRPKKLLDPGKQEAIRVVDPKITPEKLSTFVNNPILLNVYKLIWQRTIAAAMVDYVYSEIHYVVSNNKGHKFLVCLATPTKLGYKSLYNTTEQVTLNNISFKLNETITGATVVLQKNFTQPKARFTEDSLVNELRKKEIGRPGAYITIIEALLNPNRGYARLKDNYIVPTDRGMQLADYCSRSFSSLISIDYMRKLEANIDKIATGELSWLSCLNTFYKDLQKILSNINETGLAAELPTKICPRCKKQMIVRRSSFGRLFYGCSAYPECKETFGIN